MAVNLNLGSGTFPLDGWQNLDLVDHPGVIRCDLTDGIPFTNESVDLIRSEHFLEHISLEHGQRLLFDCFRVLKKGGRIRISVPSLETAILDYMHNKLDRAKEVGLIYKSRGEMLNRAFHDWGHKCMYDTQMLTSALHSASFVVQERQQTSVFPLELRPFLGDLILEALKP